jgi:hypothetical protein
MTGRKLLFAVSLILPALAPVCALAADVKAQSSTQYFWYNDPFQNKTQGGTFSNVKLSATKIDAANRLSASATAGSPGSSERAGRRIGATRVTSWAGSASFTCLVRLA